MKNIIKIINIDIVKLKNINIVKLKNINEIIGKCDFCTYKQKIILAYQTKINICKRCKGFMCNCCITQNLTKCIKCIPKTPNNIINYNCEDGKLKNKYALCRLCGKLIKKNNCWCEYCKIHPYPPYYGICICYMCFFKNKK